MTIVTTPKHDDLRSRLRGYFPKTEMGTIVRQCFKYLPPELAGELLDQITRVVVLQSSLHCVIFKADGRVIVSPDAGMGAGDHQPEGHHGRGRRTWWTAGRTPRRWRTSKYHGIGAGSTAEESASLDRLDHRVHHGI